MPIQFYFCLALVMFLCGILGVLLRRNIIFILMSIELMLNAANLVFVSSSTFLKNLDGQIMVFFIVTIAACEAAVGLAMVVALFRRYGTISTDFYRILRG